MNYFLKLLDNRLFKCLGMPIVSGLLCWAWLNSQFDNCENEWPYCIFGALIGANIPEVAKLWSKRRERKLETPRPSNGEATTQDAAFCADRGIDSSNHRD